MGPYGFTSHPKEVVLQIFIDLKIPSPWPGSNPQTLGPVASTLTTTSSRRLSSQRDTVSPHRREQQRSCETGLRWQS
jgi:hypothetical protein